MGAVGAHGEEFVSWEIPDIANRKMRHTLRCCGLFSVMTQPLRTGLRSVAPLALFGREAKRSRKQHSKVHQQCQKPSRSNLSTIRPVLYP